MDRLFGKQFIGSGKRVLFIGDSFSADIINAISESTHNKKIQFSSLIIRRGCGNLYVAEDFSGLIDKDRRHACSPSLSYKNPRYIKLIKNAEWILLASNWEPWEVQFLQESIKNLSDITRARIYVVGSKRFGHVSIRDILKIPRSERGTLQSKADSSIINLNNQIRLAVGDERYIDLQGLICSDNGYCPIFDENSMKISFDGKHLTPSGWRYLGQRLQNNMILREILE